MIPPEYQPSPPAIPYPDPYPTENCVLTDNDYRGTGLPGWGKGNGCILLQSFADVGGYGTEVRNNLITETGRFPKGTGGPAQQVFEYKTSSGLVHDNRIVGMPANFVADRGIGQRLKAMRNVTGSYSQADPGNVDGKKGMKCGEETVDLAQAASEAVIPISEEPVEASVVPSRPQLVGNYPNPFNPSTSIRYGLSEASYVRIAVYNALGQVVAQLVGSEQPAGYHEVRFDASGLASGVYVVRLQAGNFLQTRKLMLTK